mgnify:CR=1 FL=1
MFANSKGQDLTSHLKAVSYLAKSIAESLGMPKPIIRDIEIAGLLHDIGKTINPIQEYLTGCPDDEEEVHDFPFSVSAQRGIGLRKGNNLRHVR